MKEWWRIVMESTLAQGDLLLGGRVPNFPSDYGTTEACDVRLSLADLIILTQSCDLANEAKGIKWVMAARVESIPQVQQSNPFFANPKNFEPVRQGRIHYLHLLPNPLTPDDKMTALIVDFRQTFSLPFEYVRRHALTLGERPRLNPPYLEHFSQAYARFYMRVGLPSDLPAYK